MIAATIIGFFMSWNGAIFSGNTKMLNRRCVVGIITLNSLNTINRFVL